MRGGDILGIERRRRWSDQDKLLIVSSVGTDRVTVIQEPECESTWPVGLPQGDRTARYHRAGRFATEVCQKARAKGGQGVIFHIKEKKITIFA